ncbi:MAG: glycoside hydrolase family 2 protein [Planctomycetota bacterium]
MAGSSARTVLPLNGEWLYRTDPDGTGDQEGLHDPALPRDDWGTMQIPVNWYNTEVGDYHGVVWFVRCFEMPEAIKGKHLVLRFNAVDYIADVWLNGVYLGRHEGFFAPFQFRVTDHVTDGTNALVVRVDSPRDPTEYRLVPDPPDFERALSEPFKTRKPVALTIIKGSLIDFYHRPGWATQFGQDGNTGGIWQGVELIATGSLTIEGLKIYPKLVERDGALDGTALVSVDLEVHNAAAGTVEAEIGLEMRGKNFEGAEPVARAKKFVLTPGLNVLKLVQTVEEPALWWCWDQGRPNLYEMRVTASTAGGVQDEVVETFGIRELKLDQKGQWHLNGRRLFARGMRYHSSIWLGEADEDVFRADLERMRQLHINAIRIGSHVEQPAFYRLCDEMGFLLWQVFPLHWGNYADTDDVIERAAPMMADMVRMLYNHPSIVIWSTFKEPNVYPFRPAPNLYGRLCQVLYEAASAVDPIRWVHKGDYEEGVQNVMTGLWGEKRPDFRNLDDGSPQKVEFGTAALCPVETARQILEPDEQWPPDWDRWYYLNCDPHWLHLQGIDVDAMEGLEEVIGASQTWAARQIKESVEYIRQRKYEPNASLFLYFWSDPWPCLCGSGLLDYYRRKYKAYDIFGMVYSPVLVSIEWLKDKHVVGHQKHYAPGEDLAAKIWVTSDLREPCEGASLSWQVRGPGDEVLAEGERTLSIPPDSSQVVENLLWPIPQEAAGGYRVDASLRDGGGEALSRNYFEFQVTGAPPAGT